MIDQANLKMKAGAIIACERVSGKNDNMSTSHFHSFFELYYLESGQRYHFIGEDVYHINPGEFVLFAPYVMHHSYGDKDVHFQRIVVYFSPSCLLSSELLQQLKHSSGVYHFSPKECQQLYEYMQLLLHEEQQDALFSKETMHSLLHLLMITFLRNQSPCIAPEPQNRISKIVSYIHEHYEETITLSFLSQQFFMSPYHLCREFKRYTNSTLIQYLNMTRILHAQKMLQETTWSITQISQATGFSNVTHFNRVFKSITGMTPSDHRRLGKQTP